MPRRAPLLLLSALVLAGCVEDAPGPLAPERVSEPAFLSSPGAIADSIGRFDGGRSHMCGIGLGGGAWCFGSDAEGQLGAVADDTCDGMPCDFHGEQPIGDHGFRFISAGEYHTCGITEDGDLYCWGSNEHGQLGTGAVGGNSTVPQVIPIPGQMASVAAGGQHTCAVTVQGSLYCWGSNFAGQVGNSTDSVHVPSPTLIDDTGYLMVAAGGSHTCALRTLGGLFCFGNNSHGQLGLGISDNEVNTPTRVPTRRFVRVAAGDLHTCAIHADSYRAWCWGSNTSGQLGNDNGDLDNENLPVRVSSTRMFRELALGASTSCGLQQNRRVSCWGEGDTGMLGNNGIADALVPVLVRGNRTYAALGASFYGACAVGDDGYAYCWGAAWWGLAGRNPSTVGGFPGTEMLLRPRRTQIARLYDAP